MQRQDLIKKVAKEAGVLFKSLGPTGISLKSGGVHDLVTEADVKTQEFIVSEIIKYFPEDVVVGEEGGLSIPPFQKEKRLWVIDPIDGTNNFSFGRNLSSATIAYVENGEPELAAVYNPYADELFFAKKGGGAYLNGEKISVSKQMNLSKAMLETSCSYEAENLRKNLESFMKLSPLPWLGMRASTALTMCDVAIGRTDLYYSVRMDYWASTAAHLIVREAGGVVKTLSGQDYQLGDSSNIMGNEKLVSTFLKATK